MHIHGLNIHLLILRMGCDLIILKVIGKMNVKAGLYEVLIRGLDGQDYL